MPDSDTALLIRSLSFPDFLRQSQVSVRLRNCLSQWIERGRFPYQTIGDYLDAGDSGAMMLMRIPNFGKRTARELNDVIAEALTSGAYLVPRQKQSELIDSDPGRILAIQDSIRGLTFLELLERCHVSVRLRNSITF